MRRHPTSTTLPREIARSTPAALGAASAADPRESGGHAAKRSEPECASVSDLAATRVAQHVTETIVDAEPLRPDAKVKLVERSGHEEQIGDVRLVPRAEGEQLVE